MKRDIFHVHWDVSAAEKGGYPHFMLKEIHEEPKALRDTLSPRMKDEHGRTSTLRTTGLSDEAIKAIQKGRHRRLRHGLPRGLVGKYAFEKLLGLPVEVDMASEFRYRDPTIQKGELFIAISQSGETADTLAAMRLAQGARRVRARHHERRGQHREPRGRCRHVHVGRAGDRRGVHEGVHDAAALPVYADARVRAHARQHWREPLREALAALRKLPEQAAEIIAKEEEIAHSAHLHYAMTDTYFLGRNLDYAIALEGSLKLKEISYIHSEAFPAGELKHGPIALIEQGTLVIALATQPALYEKLASNLKEVKARGAVVLSFCPEDADLIIGLSDEVIMLPEDGGRAHAGAGRHPHAALRVPLLGGAGVRRGQTEESGEKCDGGINPIQNSYALSVKAKM